MVRQHRSVASLVGEEALIGLKPIPQVLSESNVVFFSPKLKRGAEESSLEASSKLRDLSKNISRGATVVNTLPTGIGGNSDNLSVIEKQTGFKAGETLSYAYCPLTPRSGEPTILSQMPIPKARPLLEDLGMKRTAESITRAELAYVSKVLGESVSLATEIELDKKARDQKIQSVPVTPSERYIDDLASYLYDLTAIHSSEDVGEPITYMAGAAIKSLENYTRYVVDQTRELLRELQLKASRTKVLVAWSLDRYEMRADRLRTAESLSERLRDYVTDIEHIQGADSPWAGGQVLNPDKHNIAVACSARDYEWMKGVKKGTRGTEVALLRAIPSLPNE